MAIQNPQNRDPYQYRSPNAVGYRSTGEAPRDNVVVGSLWMIGITLLLFFLPAINGFIGGLVGGYKVGSVKRAVTAAILPAIVVAIGLWVLLALLEAPIWGALAGITAGILILLSDLGIFLGAVVGGAARRIASWENDTL